MQHTRGHTPVLSYIKVRKTPGCRIGLSAGTIRVWHDPRPGGTRATQRPTVARLATAPVGSTMANTVRLGPRRNPIAEPEPPPRVAWPRAVPPDQPRLPTASSLRPPACALMTAGSTRWAWVEIDLRLYPVSWARRVTASQPTVKTVTALPLDLSTATLSMAVRLPAPRVSRRGSMLRRLTCSRLAQVSTTSAATRCALRPSPCATTLSGSPGAPRPRTIACTRQPLRP